jgi:hypothetical protein
VGVTNAKVKASALQTRTSGGVAWENGVTNAIVKASALQTRTKGGEIVSRSTATRLLGNCVTQHSYATVGEQKLKILGNGVFIHIIYKYS